MQSRTSLAITRWQLLGLIHLIFVLPTIGRDQPSWKGETLFLGMAEWRNIPSNPKARNDRISYKTEQLETKTRNKKEWKRKKI